VTSHDRAGEHASYPKNKQEKKSGGIEAEKQKDMLGSLFDVFYFYIYIFALCFKIYMTGMRVPGAVQ